ncbi:MAG: hypothetical protein J3K34DRAFT_493377 [Monoraphidium minutum]|nr:MAG: hypothetical protein J3K34DRAFT_493377 [Monoraphidium minutum]
MSCSLASDVRRIKATLARDGGGAAPCPAALCARLSALGWPVAVRSAAGGPARGAQCFKSLRHVFIVAAAAGPGGAEGELIVDASFKEHFLIPHPTPAFLALLAALPDEFVGPRARLAPLVQRLSEEMAASFDARGLTLPPWRRAAAVASKWLPQRCSGAGPRGGAGAAPPAGRGGCGSAPAAAAAAAAAFSRLDDSELLRHALARRRAGSRGLLSGKLLAGSPPPPHAPGGDAAAAVAAPAAAAAAAAAGHAQGTVSRHPPVCSGQPATWRVRVASHLQQPPQRAHCAAAGGGWQQ